MRRARGRADDPGAREVPAWLRGGLVLGTLAGVLWLERRRPLRGWREPKLRHDLRNAMVAALAGVAIRVCERPLTAPAAALVQRRRLGVVKRLGLPRWLEVGAAVVLLDYTLYVWHVLTHRLPFLWRFHRVHHADLDLSATTAIRFHFAEMMLSVPWRVAQVLLIGASPLALSAWQTLTVVAILFHHANVHVPLSVERWLCRLVMTPRMHGIHHSIVRRETDANWSTIFSWPDWLHRTHRLDVPQDAVVIGVPEYRAADELTLGKLVEMPFGAQRPPWRLPDGTKPVRARPPGASSRSVLAP